MWKYILAWFPMVLIAVINGAMREEWYGKHLTELQAHQVSTVTGVLLFGVLHLGPLAHLETCVRWASPGYWSGVAWNDRRL